MSPQLQAAFALLPEYLGWHVLLSVSALALGLAISLPLAVAASRSARLRWPVLALASLIQTIPSLALLALFYPLLLALSLGPDIRVNCVAPGLVETPMTAGWPDMLETWNTRSPMKRAAKPEDIADLVAALTDNAYVTGEIVIADGGLNLT